MASIVIKDLPESVDLDRQAMAAITGGARARGRHQPVRSRTILRTTAVFPTGSLLRQPSAAGTGGKRG